jgi:tetrahydromethanopterin S-methyltransferase subunit G
VTDEELKRLFEVQATETRAGLAALAARIDETNARIDKTNARFDSRFDETTARFDETNARFDSRFDEVNARFDETNARIELTDARIDSMAAVLRREISVATESMKHEVQLVAEAVLDTRQEMNRRFNELDEKIDYTTEETRAMLKFSHRSLADDIAGLQTRVERLEK